MDVVVTLEHRFRRTPDGAVWTQAQYLYSFWTPYLSVFDRVRPVARVLDVPSVPDDWKRADGPRVTFSAVPYYVGPVQYALRAPWVKRAAVRAVGPHDAVIIRGGSPVAEAIEYRLWRARRPFGLEVLCDPHEALAPGTVRHPLRPLFRWLSTRELRLQCQRACAVAYVTRHTLQARYPCPGHCVALSDVQLPEEAFVPEPRGTRVSPPWTLIAVGSLEQLYKGTHILIDAVADCVRARLDLHLVVVGDGQHRPELEARARALGLAERVQFRGQLTAGAAVRAELDRADLFVMPSLTEGLPRALLEAMARGLPCLASDVGGIPELLPAEGLVPPGNRVALAAKLRALLNDPERRARMSARNLSAARPYREEVLRQERVAFLRYLRKQTETWVGNGSSGSRHHRS